VKEYLATLDQVAFGAASDVTPKFVSPSDPAAQWTGAMRGPAFFAYADNYLIDVKFGVIMDVEASGAIRQAEVGAARTMIERTEERFGLKPERLQLAARPKISTGWSTRSRSPRIGRIVNELSNCCTGRASSTDVCSFKMRRCPKEPARKISRSIHEDARDSPVRSPRPRLSSDRADTANV
jgi:hypothetical protein